MTPPVPVGPDIGLRLARWLGTASRRFWREFYYWTVGEPDGPDASTARGFCLSEVPDYWYAYWVRAERSENAPSLSDSAIVLPRPSD